MKGLRWQWLVAFGVAVAGALGALALGDDQIATELAILAGGLLGPARKEPAR